MGKPTDAEVLYQRHVRAFIQDGGSDPDNPLAFYGLDAQYLFIGGVGKPETGDISPSWVHDPRRQGQFRLLGRSINAPDLPTATVRFMEKVSGLPRQLLYSGCTTFYEPYSVCKDPSDFNNGVTAYMQIYSNGRVADKNLGDRSVMGDSDEEIIDELAYTFMDIYPIGPISFGERAAVQVDREVVDIVYGIKNSCVGCNNRGDYTAWAYAITKSSGSGSPGLPAEIHYSIDGGLNWTDANITGIGASEDPVAIEIVGDKLIVLSRTASSATTGGYYYTTIDPDTGVPGTTWTKVTSGFVANKQPNDWYVDGSTVYIVGDGGYVYRSKAIESGVEVLNAGNATTSNLYRIHGYEDHIVAVGASSTVIRSVNRGATFATTQANPSAIALDLRAVAVRDGKFFWVGSINSGRIFRTSNGGKTWTQAAFPPRGTGNVWDIVQVTDENIIVAYDDGAGSPTASIYVSHDSGITFTNAGAWLLNLPVFDRANRVAVPKGPDAGTMSAYMLVAGLGGNGTDGIIAQGQASIV